MYKNLNLLFVKLDPLPTHLVKAGLPFLSSLITDIMHASLISGTVPVAFKIAVITAILKKPGQTQIILMFFRLISNLPFLSKILERIVAPQLHGHLPCNSLYEQFQSGFHPFLSVETALLLIMVGYQYLYFSILLQHSHHFWCSTGFCLGTSFVSYLFFSYCHYFHYL